MQDYIMLIAVALVITIAILLIILFKDRKTDDGYQDNNPQSNSLQGNNIQRSNYQRNDFQRSNTVLGYTPDEVRNKRYTLPDYLGTQTRFYTHFAKNLKSRIHQNEWTRIKALNEYSDKIEITVDFHDMDVKQAGNLLTRLIDSCDRDVVYLHTVHGYNNGTAIREMIRNKHSDKIRDTLPDERNPGTTLLIIDSRPLS